MASNFDPISNAEGSPGGDAAVITAESHHHRTKEQTKEATLPTIQELSLGQHPLMICSTDFVSILDNFEAESRREAAKTEEALQHLPEELRHILMEYNPQIKIKMKDEIKFLRPLAEFYQQQYEAQPDLWMSGLRAHALWMACGLRDPDNSDYINSAMKLMKSKLPPEQVSVINAQNKNLLSRCRENHRERTNGVNCLLETIDSANWSNNLNFMTEFTTMVKGLFDDITEDMTQFLSGMFDQCVESLGKLPPCGVAVICIGSLARCETTSYSDVEYMFLIEEGSKACMEYFRQLAFQSYHFLSLLGESSLHTYSINELKLIGFIDRSRSALRIDGLSEKAGNIPTGNGLENSELIFTIDQVISRYYDVLEGRFKGPEKGVLSDFVDMITHRKLIWSAFDGYTCYTQLDKRIKAITHSRKRKAKSLELLNTDLKKYNFLPTMEFPHTGHQEVKRDIYRYPSLMLTGLKNTLDIKSSNNWETIQTLVSMEKCSTETGVILSFLLSSALFIRSDCYNFYKEQNDIITLFICEDNSLQYSCPRNLFILMTSYLFPLKLAVASSIIEYDAAIPVLVQDTFLAVCITNVHCGAYSKVLDVFASRYGEKAMFDEIDDFLKSVTLDELKFLLYSLSESRSMSDRHVNLCKRLHEEYHSEFPDLLMHPYYVITNPRQALNYCKQRFNEPFTGPQELLQTFMCLANCYSELDDLPHWEETTSWAKRCLDEVEKSIEYTKQEKLNTRCEFYLNLARLKFAQEDYFGMLKSSLESLHMLKKHYGLGVVHCQMLQVLNDIGLAYGYLNRPRQSLENHTRSWEMLCKLYGATADHPDIAGALVNIGVRKMSLRDELDQALDILTRSYEMLKRLYPNVIPTHPYISLCTGKIATCHYDMSHYREALQWYKQWHTNLTEANVVDKEKLAMCNSRIGCCHYQLEDHALAVNNLKDGLKIFKQINQGGKYEEQIRMGNELIQQCNATLRSRRRKSKRYVKSR